MNSNYYNQIAEGYDELHKEEQLKKLSVIKYSGIIHSTDLLLDVGCGTGFSLDYFVVKQSVGVEPAAKLLEQYKGVSQTIVGCAEKLPFSDNQFDVVISLTAIQNFSNVKQGLEEIRRVGKDRFALTFLKKLSKTPELEKELRSVFEKFTIEKIEEEKDYIFLIKRP